MLTQEPRTFNIPPAPRRSWRGPALALTSFAGALLLGLAVWAAVANNNQDVADGTTLPPVTTVPTPTTLPPGTTLPTVVIPDVATVPNLVGATLAEARVMVTGAGFDLVALPDGTDGAIVVAQEPAPGSELDEGGIVTVDVQVTPTCNAPDPVAPAAGEVIISVLFECDGDGLFPTAGIAVPRIVPEQDGQVIDRIEWTLRSLLAGLTPDEQIAGFTSFFDATTGGALNSVTLVDGQIVADFNDAIYVNNASTSTGGLYFNAELQGNLFMHPEVDSVEFRVNGDCEAWSAFFQSDGCWVISRADWEQTTADWEEQRNQ